MTPSSSPTWHSPADVIASFTAVVNPAYWVAEDARVIATTSSSKSASASCTATAASDCTIERVGITATR